MLQTMDFHFVFRLRRDSSSVIAIDFELGGTPLIMQTLILAFSCLYARCKIHHSAAISNCMIQGCILAASRKEKIQTHTQKKNEATV